eukprot:g25483.t1
MHFVVANIVRPLTCNKRVSFVTLWGGRQVDYFVSHSWGTSFSHFVRSIRRVWCLFEFFLSSRENLELDFGTDAGVIGDDGCTSFDIALEVGRKIKSLQVVTNSVSLYANGRATLATGLWASPPISPRLQSPRGQHMVMQAPRPGLWEQCPSSEDERPAFGVEASSVSSGQELHQGGAPPAEYVLHPLESSVKRLEDVPTPTEVPPVRLSMRQGSGPPPPGLSATSAGLAPSAVAPAAAPAHRAEVASAAAGSEGSVGATRSATESAVSAASMVQASSAPATSSTEAPIVPPKAATAPVAPEVTPTVPAVAIAPPATGTAVPSLPVPSPEESQRGSHGFDSPRDACHKSTAKTSELWDRIAQLESQLSDRANLIQRLNHQQAQLDRLEALAEENAALRSQLKVRRAKGDTPPLSARGELRGGVDPPTIARRFRTAPGEVQTQADAPVVLTTRSPRPQSEATVTGLGAGGYVTSAPTLLQAQPQRDLTQLLTEVARQREEAAQLRLRVMQAPPKPKQDYGFAVKKTKVGKTELKLPEGVDRSSTNGKARPKATPKTGRRPSPKRPARGTRPEDERWSAPRRSRPVSSQSPHPAPRLCISVPEHRLRPPEPQFLFSLPLRVHSGPKKLVDLSFRRSGSPSRTEAMPDSPRSVQNGRRPRVKNVPTASLRAFTLMSFMWSALEHAKTEVPATPQDRSPQRYATGTSVHSMATLRPQAQLQPKLQPAVQPATPTQGLSVASPAPTLSPRNFVWNGTPVSPGAAFVPGMAVPQAARSVSPVARPMAPYTTVQVPQMRPVSPSVMR